MKHDFVIDFLNKYMPSTRKRVNNGYNVNCPVCIHNGQARADSRYRCGLRTYGDGSIAINCFNCSFATRWSPGNRLTKKLRFFLTHCGAGDAEIKTLNYDAWVLSQTFDQPNVKKPSYFNVEFDEHDLPPNAKSFTELLESGCNDSDFHEVVDYAIRRSDTLFNGFNFYWTPDKKHEMNRRLILPYYFKGKIVGYTGRCIDPNNINRYYSYSPAHFIVNNNSMYKDDRKYVILTEGVLDALAIDGAAAQGAKISDEQAQWLTSTNKTIIVLPDKDTAGQKMIDAALKYDFHVSFPVWDDNIKDAAEATLYYGRAFTVKSIIDNSTSNKFKINLIRKRI